MTTPRIGPLGVLSATGNMLYRDASGEITEVDTSAASNGDVLTRTAGVPAWVTPAAADTDFTVSFSPADAVLAAVNSKTGIADIEGRNNHPIAAFADTAAAPADDENVVFAGTIPISWETTNVIRLRIMWVAATATSGTVFWGAAIERDEAGVTDLDTDSFDTTRLESSIAPGVNGVVRGQTVDFTQAQADDVEPGDAFRLQVFRNANAAGDTMVGDAQAFAFILSEGL